MLQAVLLGQAVGEHIEVELEAVAGAADEACGALVGRINGLGVELSIDRGDLIGGGEESGRFARRIPSAGGHHHIEAPPFGVVAVEFDLIGCTFFHGPVFSFVVSMAKIVILW